MILQVLPEERRAGRSIQSGGWCDEHRGDENLDTVGCGVFSMVFADIVGLMMPGVLTVIWIIK